MSTSEIAAVLARYAAAILAGDHVALDTLLDADYEFISNHARVVDRERRLTTLTASPGILSDLTFSDLDVRIVESVAIVRADFSAVFQPHSGRTDPDRGVSTLILSRHGDRWRLRHQHNSHGS